MNIHDFYVHILIPSLIGTAVGIIYAMIFLKERFRPRRVRDEHGKVTAYYPGWLSFLLVGLLSGLFAGSFGGLIDLDFIIIIIFSIICAFLFCKIFEHKQNNK